MPTVCRMGRIYGTVIQVPSTVPVHIWSCATVTRIWLVANRIVPYFDGRKRQSYGSYGS